MNVMEFVQNIKKYCDIKGVKPTVACKESGAGKDLINQIERRGSMPSVEKVQMLADYLGVTTSELLGETDRTGPGDKKNSPQPNPATEREMELLELIQKLTPEEQDREIAYLRSRGVGKDT